MRATVAVLNRQAVGGIGVVAGPDLVGPAQHAQVGAPAAAGARLPITCGNSSRKRSSTSYRPNTWRAQTSRCERLFGPADLGPRAVVVPLHELDATVIGKQVSQLIEDALAHVRAREVQDKLVAAVGGSRPVAW